MFFGHLLYYSAQGVLNEENIVNTGPLKNPFDNNKIEFTRNDHDHDGPLYVNLHL